MGVALASFPAARLDRTARVVTLSTWVVAATFAVAGIVLGAAEPVVGGSHA